MVFSMPRESIIFNSYHQSKSIEEYIALHRENSRFYYTTVTVSQITEEIVKKRSQRSK